MSRFDYQQNIATIVRRGHGNAYAKISFWCSKRLIVHNQLVYTHPKVGFQPLNTIISFKTYVKWTVTFIWLLFRFANINALYLCNDWHEQHFSGRPIKFAMVNESLFICYQLSYFQAHQVWYMSSKINLSFVLQIYHSYEILCLRN